MIHKLPAELLSDIFLICLHSIGIYKLGPTFLPFILVQVCSRWRHCALACPRLWSTVALVCHRLGRPSDLRKPLLTPSRQIPNLTEHLSRCVARAQHVPVSITFATNYPHKSIPEDCFEKWRVCMPRCEALSFSGCDWMLQQICRVPVELLLLRRLSLEMDFTLERKCILFEHLMAPQLQSLSLGVPSISDRTRIARGKVTHLALLKYMIFDFSCAAFLQGFQSLRSLKFRMEHHDAEEAQLYPEKWMISLPHLEELSASFCDGGYYAFLSCIHTPRLRSLNVLADCESRPIISYLLPMLDRTGCQLERLELDRGGVLHDATELKALLSALPAILHLRIVGWVPFWAVDGFKDVLSQLILSGTTPLAPAMKELSLQAGVLPKRHGKVLDGTAREILNSRRGELDAGSIYVVEQRERSTEWRLTEGEIVTLHRCED
ncbi:hypothetical protein OE88DRAFT_1090062 [Heliocybe sulcata]|uniref:Uncharacterized protein n=1 Tax=Heliocybe sulcata TaxID=5364 RepID=A0A5C3MJY7_9AGAM|nr:hypothetical protein OE88DRAFT_1090062 [Heliocybe sulcata]